METLVSSHADLVTQVATAIASRLPRHVSTNDLIGWGNLGLVDAAHRFDPAKSTFVTFAKHRIRGAILDGLRSEDPVSRTERRRFRRAQSAVERLALRLGRQPDEDEVARAVGLPLAKWQHLRARFGRMGLTSAPMQPPMEPDLIPGGSVDPYEATLAVERRSVIDAAVAKLPSRYRAVILLYYRRDLTMREIAARLGVNESRVSQIHHTALGRLRRDLR